MKIQGANCQAGTNGNSSRQSGLTLRLKAFATASYTTRASPAGINDKTEARSGRPTTAFRQIHLGQLVWAVRVGLSAGGPDSVLNAESGSCLEFVSLVNASQVPSHSPHCLAE